MKSVWTGHPRGVYLVSATEMWERFSYYSLVGLLALFLTSAPVYGGFGWNQSEAVALFGLYSGLIFASPSVGGWISSRYLGEQRSIFWGGLLIATGQLSLVLALLIPDLADMEEVVARTEVALGHLFARVPAAMGGDFALVYYAQALLFASGLTATVLGTGLLKPAISSVVGMLYTPGDPRRESGFGIFMVGIWVGAFIANFIAGTIGEKYGWHYGFLAAAGGMAIGFSAYILLRRRYLGDVGRLVHPVPNDERGKRRPLSSIERRNLIGLALISLFTVIYAIAFYQKGGILNLLVRDSVDRSIGGFEIPATWLLSVTTGTFVIATPFLMRLFLSAEQAGKPYDICHKVALGLLSLAAGYVFFILGVWLAPEEGGIGIHWIIVGYVFFGIGDVFIWPPQIAMASVLAPKHLCSFVIGAWYVTVGVGSYLSGVIGAFGVEAGIYPTFFALLVMLLAATVIVLLLRSLILRLISQDKTGLSPFRPQQSHAR